MMNRCPLCGAAGYEGLFAYDCSGPGCVNNRAERLPEARKVELDVAADAIRHPWDAAPADQSQLPSASASDVMAWIESGGPMPPPYQYVDHGYAEWGSLPNEPGSDLVYDDLETGDLVRASVDGRYRQYACLRSDPGNAFWRVVGPC